MKSFLFLLLLPFSFLSPDKDYKNESHETPYRLEQRKLPSGNDFAKLLPARVGSFFLVSYKDPQPGLDGEALYRSGKKEIFMLFSLAANRKDLAETMNTILDEIKKSTAKKPDILSLKTDPAYLKSTGPTIAFFAWTRNLYCFSADSKGGDLKALDDFMLAFPY